MNKLKFANERKKAYSVNLDSGIVEQCKKYLKDYGSFSGLIDERLNIWCEEMEEQDVYYNIVQDILGEVKQKKMKPTEDKIKDLIKNNPEIKKLMKQKEEGGNSK